MKIAVAALLVVTTAASARQLPPDPRNVPAALITAAHCTNPDAIRFLVDVRPISRATDGKWVIRPVHPLEPEQAIVEVTGAGCDLSVMNLNVPPVQK